jgi:D-alanyl-D-alanine carboxypeptidase/D-alanyl-D-alanine-endopeptidase (penicillin-binding protein 4)
MGDRQRRAMISVPASLLVLLYSLPLWANPSDHALVDLEQGGLTNIEPRARAVDLPPRIDQRLPALALDPTQVSVYVHQVDADRPDLAFNAAQPRIPASVAKLVTSIAALDMLGPQHRWHTQVLIDGRLSDHRLIGDLYIKGYGDPYLTTEAYAALIRAIRAKGIEQIAGNLVFDDSHLLPAESGRGDFDGAAQSSYNALPAALSLNRQVT